MSAERTAPLSASDRAYPTLIPPAYAQQIVWNDPNDPILRQVLPDPRELVVDPRERLDPIGDIAFRPVPNLTHRHPDRVLLFPTDRCAVHCRHCFRRNELHDADDAPGVTGLDQAFAYIKEHTEIREVILTGGDPLTLSDQELQLLRARIENIPHIRLIRFHSRVPVVSPARITRTFIEAVTGRLPVTLVTHFNHPRELASGSVSACMRLKDSGITVMNQGVLLRGVNDDALVLEQLFAELFYHAGVVPYYLHHCDLTLGLRHFRTSIDTGLRIMKAIRTRLSSICVPLYVLDLPGGYGKINLEGDRVVSRNGYNWVFKDDFGNLHHYTEVVDENPA